MRIKLAGRILACLIMASVCSGFLVNNVVLAEDTKLDVNDPNAVATSLQKLVNKTVTLRLRSGEDLSGIIEAVGPSAVRLGQLTGKEFYAAIIKIDDVNAVIYRAKQ